MTESDLLVTSDGAVRIVTMNRPDHRNAINEHLHGELTRVWRSLADDRGARAVVLTGAGNAFSAGGDASWLRQVASDEEMRWRSLDEARRLATEVLACPLPTIAAVNGPAVGLGSSIASMCDIVLMSTSAYFADPHVAIGLAAGDGAVATWPSLIGPQAAKYYLFTGERIDADKALQLGLAQDVVGGGDLMSSAVALAHRLAALPPAALRATKRAVNLQIERSAATCLEFACAAEADNFTGPDFAIALDKMTAPRART
jgi:enoyl-CoA hydratase